MSWSGHGLPGLDWFSRSRDLPRDLRRDVAVAVADFPGARATIETFSECAEAAGHDAQSAMRDAYLVRYFRSPGSEDGNPKAASFGDQNVCYGSRSQAVCSGQTR
jgi:hypothetical protein